MTSVREFMHPGLITCAPDTALGQVARLLREHRIHAVVVIDTTKHVVGVVSDTDLLAGEWLGNNAENVAILRRMTAGELMTKPVATIDASSTPQDAAAEIRRQHVARLVVTDDHGPIGVVSISDLLAALPNTVVDRVRVRDVMSWGYVACRPSTPVSSAARAMLERDSRSLIVIDEHGTVVGVVTGFDLLAVIAGDAQTTEVADFMHPPIAIGPDAKLQDAVDLMLNKSIHRLVVVNPDRPTTTPLGLVSTTDIMVEMASPSSAWRSLGETLNRHPEVAWKSVFVY
jgi:CBS domain-containing protein